MISHGCFPVGDSPTLSRGPLTEMSPVTHYDKLRVNSLFVSASPAAVNGPLTEISPVKYNNKLRVYPPCPLHTHPVASRSREYHP